MRACFRWSRIRGVPLLLLEPSELVRELFTLGVGHREVDDKTAGDGVADLTVEPAEITEVGRETITDLSHDGDRDHHPKRRNAAGPAGEAAWLPLRIIPVWKRVPSIDHDIDGTLSQNFINRHCILNIDA